MQQSPEATRSPFLLYKLHESSWRAGFARRFPWLCLSLRLAEEETLLCLGAGGEDRPEATERTLLRSKWGNGRPLTSIVNWGFTFVVALYVNQGIEIHGFSTNPSASQRTPGSHEVGELWETPRINSSEESYLTAQFPRQVVTMSWECGGLWWKGAVIAVKNLGNGVSQERQVCAGWPGSCYDS